MIALKDIKEEIDNFNNNYIEIVPGFEFNQKETINKIYFYFNSQFESGEFDDQGDKKYFYNINRTSCDVGTKATDFDTKDINIQTAGGGNPLTTWFFERDLKFWMKDQKFGKVLNRIFHELPIFGSVILKIIDGKPYFVDLRNFVNDQAADTLDQSDPIIEIHNYTSSEFRRIGKEKKWDNVNEAISAFREGNEDYIIVYERYGEIEEDEKYPYKRIIMADVGREDGFILKEEEVDGHPYREIHWQKIPGRWLGIGRVEILFDPQIRINEISNQESKSSYWSTLRLWQTRDEGINKNLLTDVENGEVLSVESEISQVDMADRNLAYYNQEITRWLRNRDELTMSYDVMRGERLPSGTPLGSAQLAAGMAGSYFDQIRENIGLDIEDLFYKIIIPQFQKENKAEHILRLAGEDLDKINNLIIESRTKDKLFEFLAKEKKLPNIIQFELMKSILAEQVKKGKEKMITMPDSFYKNIEYKIDLTIVGESLDIRIKAANLFAALQAVTADPTLLTDPTKRKFFTAWLEQGNISLIDFEPEIKQPSIQEIVAKRAGGGISKPTIPAIPVAGTMQATL